MPETPPARRNRVDSNLTMVQRKLEHAMNAMVHSQETNSREQLGQAAAWVRSAWEDILQQRRHLLAGKQSFKLDKRTDDTRTRLLNKEEEDKINKARRPATNARKTWWGDTQTWAGNSSQSSTFPKKTGGKGKGKGKGRGKGL